MILLKITFACAFICCIFAAPGKLVSDVRAVPNNETVAAPKLPKKQPTLLPAASRRELQARFGAKILQEIENFRSTWFKLNADEPSYVPTTNQMVWFATLVNMPTTRGRKKRSYSVRKEYRQLSCQQRTRFHRAVRALKNSLVDGVSQYDIFVQFHHPSMAAAAHGGAAFLPWHREYLWRFENALQTHDSSVSLPYWDSTLDRHLPDPRDSILWSNRFMGDQSGPVTSGPFGNWNVIPTCQIGGSTTLRRNVGGVSASALIDDTDYNNVMSHSTFQDLVVPPTFEYVHGGPHVYVGGQMGVVSCSPSDPIFWMHHAFIDRIWEDFRQNHQTSQVEYEYPTQSSPVNIGGTAHNPLSEMKPFGPHVNRDGMSNHYTNNHYQYAPRPFACSSDSQCGPNLFCHNSRCKSKVKQNGKCAGLYPNTGRACECGTCKLSGGIYKCVTSSPWQCVFKYCLVVLQPHSLSPVGING